MSDIKYNLKLEKIDEDILELFIDKKIADAKVIIFEKRINFLLAIGVIILTFWGLIVPIYYTQENEKKVDKAIEIMESKFNDLAGKALRKPKIAGYVDGKDLANNVFNLDFNQKNLQNSYIVKQIVLKNIGDGTTENISILLYLKSEYEPLHNILEIGREFVVSTDSSDKLEFDTVYRLSRKSFVVPAKDSFSISFMAINQVLIKQDIKIMAVLKIFYGEPAPHIIPFTIEIKKKINKD